MYYSIRIRISFNVQREIVTGLKYVHAVKKMGVRVENETYMVGSYGPKLEMHEYTTPYDEMPTGMLARGQLFGFLGSSPGRLASPLE